MAGTRRMLCALIKAEKSGSLPRVDRVDYRLTIGQPLSSLAAAEHSVMGASVCVVSNDGPRGSGWPESGEPKSLESQYPLIGDVRACVYCCFRRCSTLRLPRTLQPATTAGPSRLLAAHVATMMESQAEQVGGMPCHG